MRSALVYWPIGVTPRPLARSRTAASAPSNSSASTEPSAPPRHYLIGWNVRDFTVVVAAIVTAHDVRVVQAAVLDMHAAARRMCFSEQERAAAPSLTIVGLYLPRGESASASTTAAATAAATSAAVASSSSLTSSSSSSLSSAADDRALQELRSSTNAYIELQSAGAGSSDGQQPLGGGDAALPVMRSLYTSGIKFDATLHLLCFDPALFDMRRAPLPFSPLGNLRIEDVHAILAGKTASRVLRGARSVLEGPFLPPHALNLMPPLHPRHLAGHAVAVQGGGAGAADSVGVAAAAPSTSAKAAESKRGRDEDAVVVDIRSLDPTVPPRLRYPTAASLTDLSCCKTCLSGVAYVQHRLAVGAPATFTTTTTATPATTTTSDIGRGGEAAQSEGQPSTPPMQSTSTGAAGGGGATTVADDDAKYDAVDGSGPSGPIELMFETAAAAAEPVATLVVRAVTPLARVSYTASVFEYKLRELVNVLALLQRKTTSCGLHPVLPHALCGLRGERRTCLMAFAARQLVGDVFFGFIVSWLLVTNVESMHTLMRKFAWYGLHGMHVGYFDWFHGDPAGFKMNADLNEVLFLTCRKAMEAFAVAVAGISGVLDMYAAAYYVLVAISLGGASFALSFMADCCNVATLHIRVLFHAVAFFYHGLTTTTSSLVLLMRGKKDNPLKRRVDDASFDFDEVVLGTMAATACAFLIPTVAMYYFYLACARTVIWVLQESLRGCAVLCCNAPIFPALSWLGRRSQWLLTGGVVVTNVRRRAASSDVVADVAFLSLPFRAVFRELFLLANLLFAGTFSPGRILRFIWFADANSKPIIDVPNKVFRHLTEDPANPRLGR